MAFFFFVSYGLEMVFHAQTDLELAMYLAFSLRASFLYLYTPPRYSVFF